MVAAPPSFSSAAAAPIAATPDEPPDTALLAGALGLCALALAGGSVVSRVRREAGMA